MNYLLFQTFLTPGFFLVVGIIFLSAIILFYSIYKKTKDLEDKEKNVFSNYDAILEDAQKKAAEIIAHATDEAARLEFESKNIQIEAGQKEEEAFARIVKEQEDHLSKQAAALSAMYDKALAQVKDAYSQEVGQMVKTLWEKTTKNTQEMEAIMGQATGSGTDSLSKKIEEEFSKAVIEISEYKKQEIEKIKKNMQSILAQVCQEVLGRSIPLEEQEKQVLEALEKAEKEHIFV